MAVSILFEISRSVATPPKITALKALYYRRLGLFHWGGISGPVTKKKRPYTTMT